MYEPGHTYTGLPYSQVKELDKYVGYDVKFTTYLSAINNPYSVMYTENVNELRSQSAYDITYHGKTAGSYMGVDCSCFVAYSLGLPFAWKTYQYAYLDLETGLMSKVGDYTESGISQKIQPLDVAPYRTVTSRTMTMAAFQSMMEADKCIIYRMNEHTESIPGYALQCGRSIAYNDDKPTSVKPTVSDAVPAASDAEALYNVFGQRVTKSYKDLVITLGRKYVNR